MTYPSEMSKYRGELEPFCDGIGVDIGFGGDPIKPSAITIDLGGEGQAKCGDAPLHIAGDCRDLRWFRDGALDYVFSSHCLEDLDNTVAALREWVRVLRPGGRLVLLLPDQHRYIEHCRQVSAEPNPSHKNADFSLVYVANVLCTVGGCRLIHARECQDYNFILVAEKIHDAS